MADHRINEMKMNKIDKEEFRLKVKETREREWIRDAVRVRKFTGIETLEQGMDLIRFAIKMNEVGKDAVREMSDEH